MSQNHNLYSFFDNPPNMSSQKKTGHFSDNFSEDFGLGPSHNFQESHQQSHQQSHQHPQSNTYYNNIGNYQGLEWRQSGVSPQQMYNESRIPDFNKSLFGKITFVVGRRKSGKTTLIKDIARREIELLKEQAIINHFTKVIIATQTKEHHQSYLDFQNSNKPLQCWEGTEFQDNLDNLIKQVHDDTIDNSLIIIEDDVAIDDFFKLPQIIKNFFNDIQKRNITLIISLTGLPKINSQISSAADYLFLCKSLPYCELQRIGNAFLSIKLASFIRIYTEIVVNNDSIAVVDISPENLRPNNKTNIKQQNMMKLLYKYNLPPKIFDLSKQINIDNLKHTSNINFNSNNNDLNNDLSNDLNNDLSNDLIECNDNFKVIMVDSEKKTNINNQEGLLEKNIVNTIDNVVYSLNLLKDQLSKYFENKSKSST